MKRIVVCMDGTWQSLNQESLTNIGIIARAVGHKETRSDGQFTYQTVIYTQGVGASLSAVARRNVTQLLGTTFHRITGGALGEGLEDAVLDTYMRLAFDYETGDELYIFGFSRGAYAARRLSGLINTSGIVSRRFTHKAREAFRLYYSKPRDHDPPKLKTDFDGEASQFRMLYGKGERNEDGTRRQTDDVPPIQYLGVFDTVAQRGMGEILSSMLPWSHGHLFRFKNYRVSPNVRYARHAVALDEARLGFPVRLWDGIEEDNQRFGEQRYQQRWFVGGHGDIGGGCDSPLSPYALKWICDGAAKAGLRFYAQWGADKSPLHEALETASATGVPARLPWWKALQPLHYPLRARKVWSGRNRPELEDLENLLDESVLERCAAEDLRPRYRPGPLRPFRAAIKKWRKG